MAEDLPDPWRAVVEITEDAAAARTARPELVARLEAAGSRFRSPGSGVAALLDDVDRRANIDVDAPLDSSRPIVPQLKGAVRKAGAFVARHLAQQTTVLVGGLSAAVRELDQRLQRVEHDAHDAVVAEVPDVRARVATVLGSLEARRPGTRRDVGTRAELLTLPRADAAVVVGFRLVDVGPLGARLDLLDRLVAAVAPGGWVAIVSVAPDAWPDVADPVVRDLAGGGPLHPATWVHLLQQRGGRDAQVHEGTGANVIAAHW
jgi:hypothetical protein